MEANVATGNTGAVLWKRRRGRIPAYVDRVPLARRRKPDTWFIVGVEIALVTIAVAVGIFSYYNSHNLPIYAAKAYAHLGSIEAQHALSQYHLSRNMNDPENVREAEKWLWKATNNGHGLAAYNLAVAHLKGALSGAPREVIYGLLLQAANSGIHEAISLLHMCGHGQCENFAKQKQRQPAND